MGKSTDHIYMDYQAMRQKADRLEELAGEMESIIENKIACYSSGSNSWKGDSGDACSQKMKKLENNLRKKAKDLRNTAAAIRRAAEIQYRLEMRLASLVSG